jgi:hypothetical protein
MADEAKETTYEEVSIDQLFKVSEVIEIKDEERKKKSKAHLRVLSDIEKKKAADYATMKRAELKRKFDDPNSDESVVLNEDLENKLLEAVKIEIMFSKKRTLYAEVFNTLRKVEEYNDKTDKDLFKDEKFNERMEKELEKTVEKYLKSLGEDEKKLKNELRSLRIDLMLDTFYLRNSNEKTLQLALKNPKDTSKYLFKDVDTMMGSFFGTSYKQLMDAYYELEGFTDRDAKN